jgi:hypothetical protein
VCIEASVKQLFQVQEIFMQAQRSVQFPTRAVYDTQNMVRTIISNIYVTIKETEKEVCQCVHAYL